MTAVTAMSAAQDAPMERQISGMKDKFAAALPAHIPTDRFVRVALSALANPAIAGALTSARGRKSIYDACLKAASDGLLLDGREAALVQYRTKMKDKDTGREEWLDVAQYQPMVAGIMKKARNSGEIVNIVAQIVYSNDDFEINFTGAPPVSHKPNLRDRGEPVGVYAVALLKDGVWSQPEYMSQEQVHVIRTRSKSRDKDGNITGPWKTDEHEMWRKTVIKRLAKYLPSSTDRDGQDLGAWVREEDQPIDGEARIVDEAPAITAPHKARGAGAKLIAATANPAPVTEPASNAPDTTVAATDESADADM